jgi:hypothetical protein
MSQVPFFDVARYAHDAGFRGEPHAIVVALAQPESNRNPRAHNGDDPFKGSFGLLQINGVHLEPGGSLDGWTVEDLYDPAKNLKAAFIVWSDNGKSFEPWGAFTSDLHKPSMDAAKVALDGFSRWKLAQSQADYYKTRAAAVTADNLTLTTEAASLKAEVNSWTAKAAVALDKISRAREALA